MIVLKVEPEKAPERVEISGDLESMQQIVGGSIQTIYPFSACFEDQNHLPHQLKHEEMVITWSDGPYILASQ